jgi:hypothetical protein
MWLIKIERKQNPGFEEFTAKLQLEEGKVNAKLRRVDNQNHLVIAEEYNLLKKSLGVIQCAKSQLALREAEIETQELDKQHSKLQIDLAGLEDDYMKISSENLSVNKE